MTDAIMTFWRDVKYAARSLARTKGLTVTVVLTLALDISANAAIFTLVRGVLLRPLWARGDFDSATMSIARRLFSKPVRCAGRIPTSEIL